MAENHHEELEQSQHIETENNPPKSPETDQPSPELDSSTHTTEESENSNTTIIVDRVRAKTIKLQVKMNDIDCDAVIDTGAEVTVINEKLFKRIPSNMRPKIRKAEKKLVVAEANKDMTVCGVTEVTLSIGKMKIKWPVYVAPIRDEVLLGWDLMSHHKFAIDPEKGFRVGNEWLSLNGEATLARVCIRRAVTIPAMAEFVLTANCEQDSAEDFFFEPSYFKRVTIAKTLVTPCKNKVPVRIVNFTNSPYKIKKNTTLGHLTKPNIIQETGITINSEQDPSIGVCRIENHSSQSLLNDNLTGNTGIQRTLSDKKDMDMFRNPDVELKSINEEIGQTEQNEISNRLPAHLTELFKNSVEHLSPQERTLAAELLCKYEDSFAKSPTDLGRCSLLKHKIDTAEAMPIRQPMRRTPQQFEAEEEKYLRDQLAAGVIRPSNSPWSSPTVLVRKKDGGVRWCIDYRKLNDVTVKDAYPLPKISMCLDCLASAKMFSTVDLQVGYWQLEVEEEDKPKTAFISKYGLFEYNTLPFGLCNAPSTFQRCMEMILKGLQWITILIYLDDVIIMSTTFNEHIARLGEVLSRIKEAGLKLKPSKCELFKPEVLFLGHIAGQDGIRPNPKLVESIRTWKEQTNVKEIQQFIGLCNYYRQYIQNFSERAAPMTRLTQKKIPFKWDHACQLSFDDLREALCSAPVLAYPQNEGEFVLDTDASDVGVGAVLSQVQNGVERVIAYASTKLSKCQKKYSVTRRELLAVVTFTNHFRHYLLGRKFLLRTDHGSLQWIFNFKDPVGQVARWLESLSQYNFKIQHRPGKKHQNADSLSRKDFDQQNCHELNCRCEKCIQQQQEWSKFDQDIDTVTDLAQPDVNKCRAVTRQQTRPSETPSIKTTSFLPHYTHREIAMLQRQDTDLCILHEWVDKEQIPSRDEVNQYSPAVRRYWLNWDNITRIDQILYQKLQDPDNLDRSTFQMIVPTVLQKEVLHSCHDSVFAGHQGVNKTAEKLRKQFYWYKYKTDVKNHIARCSTCNKSKAPARKPKAPLGKYYSGYPLDRLGMDIMGPLPPTKEGNRYILVIGDYFTRYMEAYALPTQSAEEVTRKLVFEFICRYGIPLELHSDQGRNFESELIKQICELLQMKKTRTTPYRPSSNGLIERFNSTFGKMLMKFVNQNTDNWDQYIGLLLAAYRSTPHPSTGYTPNMMMFGREVNLPADVVFPFPHEDAPKDVHDYVHELRSKMEKCFHLSRQHLQSAAARQKHDYDSRIQENKYQIGDLVYKRCVNVKKLQKPWDGPYIIKKLMSNCVYLIQGRSKTTIVHHDRLKVCQLDNENIPKWAKQLRAQLTRENRV